MKKQLKSARKMSGRPADKVVTEQVLKMQLSATEKRLDAKIDSGIQSMKEYTDSRTQQVNGKIQDVRSDVQSLQQNVQSLQQNVQSLQQNVQSLQQDVQSVQQVVEKQGSKMDRYFEGIVKMIENLTLSISRSYEQLGNHEKRIAVLEEKTP